jgi:hypothetical protein
VLLDLVTNVDIAAEALLQETAAMIKQKNLSEAKQNIRKLQAIVAWMELRRMLN